MKSYETILTELLIECQDEIDTLMEIWNGTPIIEENLYSYIQGKQHMLNTALLWYKIYNKENNNVKQY